MEYQQNPETLPIPVIALIAPPARLPQLELLLPEVLQLLDRGLQNRFYRIEAE